MQTAAARQLLIVVLLGVTAQICHGSMVCRLDSGLWIGTTPGHPFIAVEIVGGSDSYQISNGVRTSPAPPLRYIVARDARGYVIQRRPSGWNQGQKPELESADVWDTTICNPESQTTIRFNSSADFYSRKPGAEADKRLQDRLRPYKTFNESSHGALDVRWPQMDLRTRLQLGSKFMRFDHLPDRVINGIYAEGVRQFMQSKEEPEPISTIDTWFSSSLEVVLERKDIRLKGGQESWARLDDLQQEDPDPVWFKIPDGYVLAPSQPTHSLGTPAAGRP